jgi:hypothetical protein
MALITREHADKIVKKLRAKLRTSRTAHDLAEVTYKGVIVVGFGLRRSSSKDTGHGHIPNDLHLSPHQTLALANCPLSRDQYVKILKEKGYIVEDEDEDEVS